MAYAPVLIEGLPTSGGTTSTIALMFESDGGSPMSVSNQSQNPYGQIMVGDDVFGSDAEKLGKVADVSPGFITVEKGFFFPTDYFIPRAVVQDTADGQVYLAVSKDEALHSGWDLPPTDVQTATGMTMGAMTEDELIGMRPADVGERRGTGTAQIADQDEIHIPIVEEELTATVRPTEAGAVRVEKTVVSEDRVLDVPVTEEQIRVERRVVDRPVDAADQAPFEQVVVEVPLRQETVDVQKQARVKEDVVISKEAVQHTEQVADTVRREEVHIEGEPRAEELNP
jgi:uncharacterized protein (TIGR02271 family)